MIFGGVLTAILLARGLAHAALFRVLVVLGLCAALLMFWPGIAQLLRLSGFVAWLVVSGACIAAVTAMLPRVVANPLQGAAAAGLLRQVAALTTFFTPQIWLPILGSGRWFLFIAVIAAAGLAGVLLFRGRATRSADPAEPALQRVPRAMRSIAARLRSTSSSRSCPGSTR